MVLGLAEGIEVQTLLETRRKSQHYRIGCLEGARNRTPTIPRETANARFAVLWNSKIVKKWLYGCNVMAVM